MLVDTMNINYSEENSSAVTGPEDLFVGKDFDTHDTALDFLDSWSQKNFCPLTKVNLTQNFLLLLY